MCRSRRCFLGGGDSESLVTSPEPPEPKMVIEFIMLVKQKRTGGIKAVIFCKLENLEELEDLGKWGA